MPVSPRGRNSEGGQPPDGGSAAGSRTGKAKRKSKPTSSRRAAKQKIKERYAKAREDAQTAGVIPVTPEGAVRDERVDPAAQGEAAQALPALVRAALRDNWATPDAAKPAVVASLLRPFYEQLTVLDKDGNEVQISASPKLLVQLAQTLRLLDQTQFSRDHPEEAGKARGGNVASVSVQMNVAAAEMVRGMIERGEIGGGRAVPAPVEPGTPGDCGHARQVEVRPPPPADQ